ncbi:monothiol glutaredoxin-S4, mitochondrial-like [Zingiber officinale]|uniref:Glutaredoxin domain-containing protein n=1 Tax=Zingiber officinale TaxID=94328 RepID=A0A8J5H596_ZINOF|nr:monothiol glutaredoxin-S4, mitochondrial-like [Zingiber officinale]XP_042468639.1 monothiol glutaredoxin-S4, mitochondrial-like [Zingiber officinale]XP_042468640.1 monothiol glutaredoxin-S4, mitochondrial-like [Zingiber officinale]KAG6520569.1 hypothetical protein ZIOFF_017626 [Zingiber officinale]
MARQLSTKILRATASSVSNAKVGFGPFSMQYMNYSTKQSGDSDVATSITYPSKITTDRNTHEDFQPTNKSTGSLLDIVDKDVKENPVLIYMKGLPGAPRCGFSALAVKVLRQYDVPIKAIDILGDLKLQESVKAYTNWPTFPQVFIKREFVGGPDMLLNMHQNGELKDLLVGINPDGATKLG